MAWARLRTQHPSLHPVADGYLGELRIDGRLKSAYIFEAGVKFTPVSHTSAPRTLSNHQAIPLKPSPRANVSQPASAESSASPASDVTDVNDRNLGMRLRAMRTEQGLTLKELAARTDMSIGMLSQIERGVSSPSMRSLRHLCAALGVDGAALFTSTDAAAPNTASSEFVVWGNQRKPLRLADSGVTKYRVTPSNCASLEAFLMELEPGAASDPNFLVQTGDKVGYVISGKLRVFIGDEILLLQAGDTYGFAGNRGYRWENGWDKRTVFLVVNSNHFYV